MKTDCKKPHEVYSAPLCWSIGIESEGLLCDSSDKDAGNESYDSWNNYDNDGWH